MKNRDAQLGDCLLMHGDCLERMREIPDGSVDMILTDPPYGMDFQSSWVSADVRKSKIANDKQPFIWFLYQAAAKLKPGGCAIIFCRWDSWNAFSLACEWAGLDVKNQIVWDKLNHSTGDLKGSPGNRHEIGVFATKGRFTFHGKRPQGLGPFKKVSGSKLLHPNEKPVDLMEWLVDHYAPPGGKVLDCFAGVSPVGVACARLNRGYVGIELDENYFQIAAGRIAEDMLR